MSSTLSALAPSFIPRGEGIALDLLNANISIANGPSNLCALSPMAAEFVPADNPLPQTKGTKSLSFCYLNARSILARSSDGLPRFDHLYNFVCSENSYDIILVTETHLDNSIDSSEINIDGYHLFRRDRNRHGGGVAVYVSEKRPRAGEALPLPPVLAAAAPKTGEVRGSRRSPLSCRASPPALRGSPLMRGSFGWGGTAARSSMTRSLPCRVLHTALSTPISC